MFQKLKDKLAEEVKQSSLKFPVSVQQITQAVSSASPNKLLNSEPSKEKENDDVLNESSSVSDFNSEFDSSFTTIDLRSPTPNRNRRSSTSSDLFPIYEFLPTRHNLQSDLESNSEFDDGSSIHQFTNVSKEILYEKYRNMLQKYHKYRGRFVDMRKYCSELEREHDKIKNVLTETQDKAIRRTKELKEQCALEQTAKAHLEGVLRNELEERDLIISTLKTKIKFLKSGKDNCFVDESSKALVDFSKNQAGCDQVHFTNSFQEVELLKDKIKNFELLLSKAKEAITTKNNQMKILENRIETGKNELKASNEHISRLQNKIDLMKHKEEEALLSLAENKMVVHRELEAKEKHIKILEDKISRYESETQKLKTKGETDVFSNLEKLNTDEIRAKDEEIQRLKDELRRLKTAKPSDLDEETLIELDQTNGVAKAEAEDGHKNVAKIDEYLRQIEGLKSLLSEKQRELAAKDNEIVQLKQIRTRQENDISTLRSEVTAMKDDLSDQSEIRDEISSLNKSLCQMRDALNEKDQQLKSHVETVSKLRSELSAVNAKLTDASKYQKMYEETLTNSKADKIVAEEMMKNAKNELNASQVELRNAKMAIEKYEAELKAKEAAVEENQKLEEQLLDYKNNLTAVTESLEKAKKVEHEMHVQTANFLEEINKLKSKEDEYLGDIRKLKEDLSSFHKLEEEVKHLNAIVEESRQQSRKLVGENEAVKLENASFKERIDELHGCITQLEQSFLAKKKSLEAEQKSLEADRRRYTTLVEDQSKFAAENDNLRLENARIVKNNEEMSEKIGELFEENKSLQSERESLREHKVSVSSQIEKLKQCCKIDDLSDAQTILAAVPEKFVELSKVVDELRTENKFLRCEVDGTQVLVKELEDWRQKFRMLVSENRQLEEKLSEERSKFEELQSQYSQSQNEKFIEHSKMIDELRTENECLKGEVAETKVLAEEVEDWRQKFQMLDSENRKLEEKLSEERSKFEELQSQYSVIQNELKANKKRREENDKRISDLEEKLALSAQTSEFSTDKTQNLNKFPQLSAETCSKLAVGDLETTASNVRSLPASVVDAVLLIRSQLLELKAKNAEMKTDLLELCRFSTDHFADDDVSLAHLTNMVENCETENQSIRKEVLLLRKEKADLLRKIENLEREIEDFKVDATETLHNRESFYKEKYSNEMMEIITGYEKRLAEKDNEYESLQNKMNLRNDRENTAMYQETKEVIQNLQEELTARQDSYAELLVKHKNEVEELNQKLSDLKEQYARDLRDNDKKWRSCLDKKMDEVEEKYKEEINELTKEWTIDRKPSPASSEINSKDSEEFLEESAKHSDDSEALKKQVQVLSNELNNCKRSHWREIDLNLMNTSYENAHHSSLTLDDCTEMEYLRNILFKYMMGHQPMVLAKVLAAVVKFDNQQTEQILLREEQKQTLMGHLGFS